MKQTKEMQIYAEVLIRVGVDLKDGQALCVEAPVDHREFVEILAREAYRAGCSEFGVIWRDNRIERTGLEYGACSGSAEPVAKYFAEKKAAYIRLDVPDLTIFKDCGAEALQKKAQADGAVRETFRNLADGCGQTIACLPGQDWADHVFPELEPDNRMDALWDAILFCSRCREEDPVQAWRQYQQDTFQKKKMLDEKHFIAFHYQGKGTDFWVKPAEKETWKGGGLLLKDRAYAPNIPTEEVFMAPHKYTAEGMLAASMPLNYKGSLIEGIVLQFHQGRIVEYDARKGKELLGSIIETDEGSHYIGEIALVDISSPVARVGKTFYTTLYDENAACHVAIGNALGPVRDPEERERLGLNTSKVHVDFMVGNETLDIDGQLADGTWIPVFRKGHWALSE